MKWPWQQCEHRFEVTEKFYDPSEITTEVHTGHHHYMMNPTLTTTKSFGQTTLINKCVHCGEIRKTVVYGKLVE